MIIIISIVIITLTVVIIIFVAFVLQNVPKKLETAAFLRLTKHVFGRPFVKRFALCYQTVVCLSVEAV